MWAFVFLAAGAAVLIYGIGLIRDARTCAQWPQAPGQVFRAEVQVVSREKNRTTYAPNVSYRYVVDGKSYENSRITLVPRNTTSFQQVEAMLAAFPVGGTTKVFYEPANPSNCVLDVTVTGTEWAYALGGVILLGVGLLTLKGH